MEADEEECKGGDYSNAWRLPQEPGKHIKMLFCCGEVFHSAPLVLTTCDIVFCYRFTVIVK